MTTSRTRTGWAVACVLFAAGCAAQPPDETTKTSTGALMAADDGTGDTSGGGDYVDPAQVTSVADTAVEAHFPDPEQQTIAKGIVEGTIDPSSLQFQAAPDATFNGCVNQYLNWCTSDHCGYPEPITVSCIARNVYTFSCAPRSAAYCGVRCLYNGCTYN